MLAVSCRSVAVQTNPIRVFSKGNASFSSELGHSRDFFGIRLETGVVSLSMWERVKVRAYCIARKKSARLKAVSEQFYLIGGSRLTPDLSQREREIRKRLRVRVKVRLSLVFPLPLGEG
jgi:hypothetical protein